ncbi:MAG: ArnT family glycosyltransferase [Sandaracinaceae bacterium]
MDGSIRQGRIIAALTLGACALLTLLRLSSYGIWDPWELAAADLGRQLAEGEAAELSRPPLGPWLLSVGFALFGVREWAGRLPIALTGVLFLAAVHLVASRFAGRRTALWSTVVAATTPLFLLNARQMLGAAPGAMASVLVFACAMAVAFGPAPIQASRRRRLRALGLWVLGLLAAIALAILAAGALRGAVPPLLAVAGAVVARGGLDRPRHDPIRALSGLGLVVGAVAFTLVVANAIWADVAGYSSLTGGTPRGGDPPTWEMPIEAVFHGFVPWSAILPLALARMLVAPPRPAAPPLGPSRLAPVRWSPVLRHPEEGSLRLAVVLWAAFGFAAHLLFTARYGPSAFLAIGALALACGLFLHDIERLRAGHGGLAVVAFFFGALAFRDLRGGAYPEAVLRSLPIEGFTFPEGFGQEATIGWALALVPFTALAAATLYADPDRGSSGLRRELAAIRGARGGGRMAALMNLGLPLRAFGRAWRRGPVTRVWIVLAVLAVIAVEVYGLVSLLAWDWLARVSGSSLNPKVGSVLFFVPLGVVAMVGVARLALYGLERLGTYRMVPLAVMGLAVGVYVGQVFLPGLSSHFSPREVYETYNRLAEDGEPLGEYQVGSRAAAYYAVSEVTDLEGQAALLAFLRGPDRVWAAFRAEDLAAIDRAYRREAGRHLFVADARSERVVLVTNQIIPGRENQSFLEGTVLDEAPTPEHPSNIVFDDKIELVGYDLVLPREGYVGPGETFDIVWYWKSTGSVGGGYQVFVHIDGRGTRINGDHEPVDGRYPVRLWEPGDIIVDRHTVRVPPDYGRDDMVIHVGFWAGERRLAVTRGDHDGVNRARVGVLRVR